jgi:hypothetical protein
MAFDFLSEAAPIISLYEHASELIIIAETLGTKGLTTLQFHQKDAATHFFRAFKISRNHSLSDHDIREVLAEIKSAKGHLMRNIFDAGEICAGKMIGSFKKSFNRVPRNRILISSPKYFTEITQKLELYQNQIINWKIEKSTNDVEKCNEVYSTVIEIKDWIYGQKATENNESIKGESAKLAEFIKKPALYQRIISIVLFLLSAVAGGVISWLVTLWLSK